MLKPNLPTLDSEKRTYSIRLYTETSDTFVKLQGITGIRTQDLIRTALNDFLDREDVKEMLK